jgi:hypothetical protein
MGGLWIPKELGWQFVNEFHERCYNETGCLPGHIKWTNVPNNINGKFFRHYQLLVDLYFEYNARYDQKIFFKSIIADDKYQFNHKVYNQGDPEIGFYKLYYFLILNSLEEGNVYHIRIADRTVNKKRSSLTLEERLEELKKCLNNGFIKKKQYNYFGEIILTIEPRRAKERRLIQLTDILMGAIGFHWNKLHLRSDAKKSKVYLAKYIANKIGRDNLIFSTSSSDKKFNIFRFYPKSSL